MQDWKVEHCAEEPQTLQKLSAYTYIQRRNIHQVEHIGIEDEEAYTDWECESRLITPEELREIEVDGKLLSQQAQIDYIAMMSDIDLEV